MSTDEKPAQKSYAVTITAIATLITAIGGLVYALKPSPDSNDFIQKTEKIFYGKVGKLNTTFNLIFENTSDKVKGTYYYNKKKDQIYRLSGVYTKDVLKLNEFTDGDFTAKCDLRKEDDCYSGKMFNSDGRVHEMKICE